MHKPTVTNTFLAFAALVFQAPSPLSAAGKLHQDPSIIKTAEAYRVAILAGDAAAAAATYTEDAVLMPACHPQVNGKSAIEQYYRELFAGPVKNSEFTFSYLEALALGDTGYAAGTYKQKLSVAPDRVIDDTGKFVAIVKRTSAGWKAAYVIYNSDHPQTSPPVPATALVFPFTPPLVSYFASLFR